MILLPGGLHSDIGASGGTTIFDISRGDIGKLLEPSVEGVYCHRPTGNQSDNNGFSFYVEKDFPCVHPRASELAEEQTETFAAPTGFAERKI